MSVPEIPGADPALDAETAGTAEAIPVEGNGVTAPSAAVAGEAENDRISIDVLSKEPVKTFLIDEETGTIRTVQLNDDGEPVALDTGISKGDIAKTLLRGVGVDYVQRPLVRETTNNLTGAAQKTIVNPKTGEIMDVIPEHDAFDLDRIVREYIRKELLDTSA